MNEIQKTLLYWISERENIRQRRMERAEKPWTSDPILRDYKFCNVFREHDRVTEWVHSNWLSPYSKHPNIAFAMCLARHFNWPDTLHAIGFPETWEPEKVRALLKQRRDKEGLKIYTGAYTISTCGRSMDKVDYSIDLVLTPLYKKLRLPVVGEKLEDYWNVLRENEGFASFMAGQVIADLKFIRPLFDATDWMDWAPLGPGSIRGLNRYFGRELGYTVRQAQGLQELRQVQQTIKENLGMILAVHNVQNCMCEYDKYIRLRDEGGKVRSKYPGAR